MRSRTGNSLLQATAMAVAITSVWSVTAAAQVRPARTTLVAIESPAQVDLERIARLGVEVQVDPFAREAHIFATERELRELRAAGITYRVVQEDVEAWFASRLDASLGPGSMGGYYTLAEVVAKIDSLANAYPSIISPKFSVGSSIEGRDIWAFIVSDAPDPLNPDTGRPAVFYNSLTHAREPIGVMQLLEFVEDIGRKHTGGDPGVDYLLSSRELWFVPVINPDGYYYNEVIDPAGGGMWRKNKRDNNGDGIFNVDDDGVDLNRNFGYHWGEDDIGSSPDPGSGVYRGTTPFSEPETQAEREVFNRRLPGTFQFCLNYHAHSNVYLYPWSYTPVPVDSLEAFQRWCARLSKFNHFPYGTGTDMIGYNTNGGAVDWQYGDRGVYALVPEVGTRYDYFWPPTIRIPTLVREQVGPNYLTAWMAGGVLLVEDIQLDEVDGNGDGYADPGEEIALSLEYTNAGFTRPVDGAVATLTALGSGVTMLDNTSTLGDFNPGEGRVVNDPFQMRVDMGPRSRRMEFALMVEATNGYTRIDTIGVYVGQPSLILEEDFEGALGNWTTGGGFGLTPVSPYEGTYSISDAVDGSILYPSNSLDMSSAISLLGVNGAVLRFRSRPLVGPRNIAIVSVGTHPYPRPFAYGGATDPDPTVFFTTGNRDRWEEVEIDLTPFVGTSQLWVSWYSRYLNSSVAQGGWSIDDIRLEAWTSTAAGEDQAENRVYLGPAYPNPSNPSGGNPVLFLVDFSNFSAGLVDVTLKVYDVRGRLISTVFDGTLGNRVYNGYLRWDGRDERGNSVPSGIYLLELRAGNQKDTKKVLILR